MSGELEVSQGSSESVSQGSVFRLILDHLRLNDDKTHVTSFAQGFTFLGYVFAGAFVIKKKKLPPGWRISGSNGVMNTDA